MKASIHGRFRLAVLAFGQLFKPHWMNTNEKVGVLKVVRPSIWRKCLLGAVTLLMLSLMLPIPTQATHITVMSWLSGNRDEWEAVVNSFEEKHPGIKVDLILTTSGEYWDKLRTMIAGGIAPDVIDMAVDRLPQFVEDGLLENLSPYLERDGVDLGDFFSESTNRGRWPQPGGDVYSLFTMMATTVMFYNPSLFDEAGLHHPTDDWTLETDYSGSLRKLTRDFTGDGTADQWGALAGLGYSKTIQAYDNYAVGTALLSFGGKIIDYNGRLVLDSEENLQAFNWMLDLIDRGLVAPPGRGSFSYGNVAMNHDAPWRISTLVSAGFEWDIALAPQGPAGRVTPLHGNPGFSMLATTRQKEASWLFLKHLLTAQTPDSVLLPGNVPSLRSAAMDWAGVAGERWPGTFNQQKIVDAMNYAQMIPPSLADPAQYRSIVTSALGAAERFEVPVESALVEAVAQANAVIRDVYATYGH